MKKKAQRTPQKKQNDKKDTATLGDRINADILMKLRETQKELTREETEKKEAEEARKREERRQREKNKSFEELLGESNMDWKKFK